MSFLGGRDASCFGRGASRFSRFSLDASRVSLDASRFSHGGGGVIRGGGSSGSGGGRGGRGVSGGGSSSGDKVGDLEVDGVCELGKVAEGRKFFFGRIIIIEEQVRVVIALAVVAGGGGFGGHVRVELLDLFEAFLDLEGSSGDFGRMLDPDVLHLVFKGVLLLAGGALVFVVVV